MRNIKNDKANLEKKRGLFFQIGLIIAFSILLFAFEWGSEINKTKPVQVAGIDLETEMTPITRRKELKPPMPKQYVKYEVVKNEVELTKDIELFTTEIDPNEAYIVPVIELEPEKDEPAIPKIWAITEESPEFPGGIKGLQHYIAKNTKYPNLAIENDMQGKVYVRFVINEKGEVENAHVLRSVYPILDKEALRVVQSLPEWKPGKQGGKAVKVWFTVPIVFVLHYIQLKLKNMETKKNKKSDIERYKTTFFQIGLIIALVTILGAFSLTQEKSNVIIGRVADSDYIEEMTQVTVQEPPELKIPLPKQVIEILQIVDDNEDVVDEPDIVDQDIGEDTRIEFTQVITLDEEVEDDPIIFIPDKMPEFPGGDIGLVKYISKNVKYPNIARENGLEEKIYIRFCVTKEGKVERVSVLRGSEPILYKEALRVVKALPKWKPGEKNGKNVNVWYTVPINFRLR